jgi:glycosyltransferase involved in cell wall biosynthesis
VARLLADLRDSADVTLVCAYRPSEKRVLDAVRPLCADLLPVERRFVADMGAVRRVSEWTTTGFRRVTSQEPMPVLKLHRGEIRRAIRQALRSGPFDVVHVELAVMGQYVDCWGDLPAVLVDHEAGGAGLGETERWNRYVRQVYPRFRRVLTLTEEDRQDLLAIEPGLSIVVRPPGVEVAGQAVRRPETDRVLFFGSPSHVPNRDALAWLAEEIAPRIRALRPQAHFACAGFSRKGGGVESAAAAAGIELLGFVRDLDAELARASLVIAPVRLGRGIRMKNLEALAHGVPLLTTSVGARGLGALAPGALSVADDAQGLTDAAVSLLAERDRAEAMGALGREEVRRHFPFARQAETTLEVWNELVRPPRSSAAPA